MENIENLKKELVAEIETAQDLKSLEEVRVAIIGKKGKLTALMKDLSSLSVEEKKEMGKNLNLINPLSKDA